MGQAPATGRISLRTTPRNFPGRSGTAEDQVYLCSPETAAASALSGCITDPRTLPALGSRATRIEPPVRPRVDHRSDDTFAAPLSPDDARRVALVKGPNVKPLPDLEPLLSSIEAPVALKVGDDVSTDEILPAGARVLPFRSNVERIAEFAFEAVDPGYVERARTSLGGGGHVIVAGRNYGQGSSREHAALAPRTLGLRAVVAKGFARIHRQNLVNFGVLPLTFADERDHAGISAGDRLRLPAFGALPDAAQEFALERDGAPALRVRHDLTPRELGVLRAGGIIAWSRERVHA
jgi:aconitate hydratase